MGLVKRKKTEIVEEEVEETTTRTEVREVDREITVPVCDFCEQEFPEKGEKYLETVVLNPSVTGHKTRDTVYLSNDERMGHGYDMKLIESLLETDLIDWQRKLVYDSEPTDFGPIDSETSLPRHSFDNNIRDDMIAYEITLNLPEPKIKNEASIEVCEFCASTLFD